MATVLNMGAEMARRTLPVNDKLECIPACGCARINQIQLRGALMIGFPGISDAAVKEAGYRLVVVY